MNAVYNMLSFHHFADRQKAAAEMMRICAEGPILIFTFDPRLVDGLWFAEYFPTVWEETYDFFPPIEEITALYTDGGRKVEVITFELPNDMTDIFAGAAWNRPEMYLEPAVRSGISSFKLSDSDKLANNLRKFECDLKNKVWDEKYGWLRSKNTLDVGYRLICINN